MNSTAFFDPSYIVSGLVYIFPYLKVTLGLTVSSVCLGTFWALFCAFLEIRRVPLFKELAALYVLICRSLPNMVLLYLVYYGLPIFVMAMDQEGVFHFPVEKVTALQVAVVGLTLHTGAYTPRPAGLPAFARCDRPRAPPAWSTTARARRQAAPCIARRPTSRTRASRWCSHGRARSR